MVTHTHTRSQTHARAVALVPLDSLDGGELRLPCEAHLDQSSRSREPKFKPKNDLMSFGSELIRSMATREQQARIWAEARLLEAIVDNDIEGRGGHPFFNFGILTSRPTL